MIPSYNSGINSAQSTEPRKEPLPEFEQAVAASTMGSEFVQVRIRGSILTDRARATPLIGVDAGRRGNGSSRDRVSRLAASLGTARSCFAFERAFAHIACSARSVAFFVHIKVSDEQI